MWGNLAYEIEDWHVLKMKKSLDNQSLSQFLPSKIKQHIGHYTDAMCLLSEMASAGNGEISDVLLALTGKTYGNLLSHSIMSVQPLIGNWMVYAGDGETYHRVAVPDTMTVKLGDGWDELEIREAIAIGDHEMISYIVDDMSTTLARGWDSFAWHGMEKSAGIRDNTGSDIVKSMMELKTASEKSTGLTINRVLVSQQAETLLRKDPWFFSVSEPFRHVSGNLIGRWQNADVYVTNLLSADTVALMVHRGNLQYDSPFTLVIESIGRPGPLLWWGRGAMYGMGERSLGWFGAEKSIVRLTC